jgi:hypothetical protein
MGEGMMHGFGAFLAVFLAVAVLFLAYAKWQRTWPFK